MIWNSNVRNRRGDPQPRTHADARSVFTDSVYGFMAPHLRKSKQETNASNGIPETSGKKYKQHLYCVFLKGKTAARSKSSVADVLYARNAIFTQRFVFWMFVNNQIFKKALYHSDKQLETLITYILKPNNIRKG